MAVALFISMILTVGAVASLAWMILGSFGVTSAWRDGAVLAIGAWMAWSFDRSYIQDGLPMPWDARFRGDD